tara:strand:- start:1197 stop:1628 length:432 start_codon:yes stop_codon:yes gene_type:complete
MDTIIFLLGILVGYAACVVISRLFNAGKAILIVKQAEVDALEILSTAAEDRAGLYVWLEKAVGEIERRSGQDEARDWLIRTWAYREEELSAWQDVVIANLKDHLKSHDTLVRWTNWNEAMVYLVEFRKAKKHYKDKLESKRKD